MTSQTPGAHHLYSFNTDIVSLMSCHTTSQYMKEGALALRFSSGSHVAWSNFMADARWYD